jgi:hypothetical protein
MQKASEIMIPNNPVIGTKYKFGTLRVNGTVQANPTRPYNGTPAGVSGAGNIPQYSSGAIVIGDSDASDVNLINFVYVGKVNGVDRYISDRNILCAAPWNTLNTYGFVAGSEVSIDGINCRISLPSGGVKDRSSGTNGYAGGTPTDNDWDKFIQNEAGLSGLPTPTSTDKDNSLVAADYTGANNQFWNWYYEYSWCKEAYEPSSANRVVRGYTASSLLVNAGPTSTSADFGFRPVLEVLNSAPLVSDPGLDQNLGNKAQGFTLNYTVAEADGDRFSILAKLDTTELVNTSNNAAGIFSLSITGATWNSLTTAEHTITITVTDTKGAASTRTLKFTKTNTAPTAPVITGLTAGQRLGQSGSVSFNAATDADGDMLTYTLQFASDSGFTANLQTFTGSASPISFSGVAKDVSRYVRVIASDGKATTASAAVLIKIGNKLEFNSNPINRDTMPVACRVMLDWTVAEGATYTLQVCNNMNDASPTWENCTSEFNAGTAHTFTNTNKVNASWAIGLKVIINAGTATGVIEVRAFGFDITVS